MINTVKDWIEHIEIALGIKKGVTNIGDIDWTRRIYEDFCNGKSSFGATGTNAMEAMLLVIKKYNPSKYKLALTGLKNTIEIGINKGGKLIKLSKMYRRMSDDDV